jgi:AraC family transcriptional regulator
MIVRRIEERAVGTDAGRTVLAEKSNENLIVCLKTRDSQYCIPGGRLIVRSAWGGREETCFEGRRVFVDDDAWLAMCPGSPVTCRIDCEQEVETLTIAFRSGFAENVLETLLTPDDRLLARGESRTSCPLPFAPHLQPHDRSVTPVLLFIKRHCEAGVDDELWFEEQLAFLLERLLARHRQVVARVVAVPARRMATRREIFRRIALSTDFIHSSYEHPLTLADLAAAACLSRHHFLRLFKAIHGMTPHEFLQRKRTLVAARLLTESGYAVEEVVHRVGFDSRSTLFRALRRFHGVTPRECRQAPQSWSKSLGSYAVA